MLSSAILRRVDLVIRTDVSEEHVGVVSKILRHVILVRTTDDSEKHRPHFRVTRLVILMVEAIYSSETSVHHTRATQCHIREDSIWLHDMFPVSTSHQMLSHIPVSLSLFQARQPAITQLILISISLPGMQKFLVQQKGKCFVSTHNSQSINGHLEDALSSPCIRFCWVR
jgi:hypothetical protein